MFVWRNLAAASTSLWKRAATSLCLSRLPGSTVPDRMSSRSLAINASVSVVRINRSLYLMDPTENAPLASAARLRPDSARRFTIVEGDDYGHFGEEVSFNVSAAGKSTAMKYGPHTLRRADI